MLRSKPPRVLLTSEKAARKLGSTRMLVDIDLGLAFHALPKEAQRAIVHDTMNAALAVADSTLDSSAA